MAEGGENQDTAILTEGNDTKLKIEGGNVNVVAGNQIRNERNDVAETVKCKPGNQVATAMIARGERVDQHFEDCDINVVSGDQIQGDQHVQVTIYNINQPGSNSSRDATQRTDRDTDGCIKRVDRHSSSDMRKGAESSATMSSKGEVRPRNNLPHVKLWEKLTGRYNETFINKVNTFSWNNIQGGVMGNFENLSEPDREFCPRIMTDFQLFKGDYIPQDGFSAHCQPKKGVYIDFDQCLNKLQQQQNKPCVLIGQPGSGKTILMKRLTKKVIIANRLHERQASKSYLSMFKVFREQEYSRKFDVVLHMNVRDIHDGDSETLAEVIFSPSVTGLTKNELQYGMQAILRKKTNIIMFFDGLDQATWVPICDKKVGPWEKSSTARIFGNILAGHLLFDISIAISSREHTVARLSQKMRPQFIAALVGFSDVDAKSMYIEIMGPGADEDWNVMKKSNPALHSMCRTPLFLIFYIISKKANPGDPPDCASGVSVSIIQIFLESENARKLDDRIDVSALLRNLKRMAFHGTKEQRVVFDKNDLKYFNLIYEEICDIIIQVPGFSMLGQKILDGMF